MGKKPARAAQGSARSRVPSSDSSTASADQAEDLPTPAKSPAKPPDIPPDGSPSSSSFSEQDNPHAVDQLEQRFKTFKDALLSEVHSMLAPLFPEKPTKKFKKKPRDVSPLRRESRLFELPGDDVKSSKPSYSESSTSSGSSSDSSSSESSPDEDSTVKKNKSKRDKTPDEASSSTRRNPMLTPSKPKGNFEEAQVVITQSLASTDHIKLSQLSLKAVKKFTDDITAYKLREGVALDKAVAYVDSNPRETICTVNRISRLEFYRLSNKELILAIQKCIRPPCKEDFSRVLSDAVYLYLPDGFEITMSRFPYFYPDQVVRSRL